VDDALEGFVDGELAPAEVERLRDHVAGCRRCAESLELAQRIRRELPGLAGDCPPGLDEELRRRLAQERRGWSRTLRFLPVAATIVALALLGALLLFEPSSRTEPDPAEIAAAEAQIRLALAYVGEMSRRSAEVAMQEVLVGEVAQTVEDVARRLDRSLATSSVAGRSGVQDPGQGSDAAIGSRAPDQWR
jgi:anti-sigma factor RsiW